jgi:hypothetical protein
MNLVDEPMNGSSYAQFATLNISKPCSFHQLTLNREPLNFEPELQKIKPEGVIESGNYRIHAG